MFYIVINLYYQNLKKGGGSTFEMHVMYLYVYQHFLEHFHKTNVCVKPGMVYEYVIAC